MHIKTVLICILLLYFASKCAVTVSNKRAFEDIPKALLGLSNIAIQGRQNQQYYQKYEPPISYYEYYKPHKYRYGYPQTASQDYSSIYTSNQYHPQNYPSYQKPFYRKPPFFQQTQMSVMEALFSIAQNDDLQCVPKLLCEVTAGGLNGRQAGFNLPVNVNLQSLATFLLNVNSADMSPVLHFGKAAVLGFASKGNTRSCQYAYPECPNDPDKLIQYLNNHKGGFFRFFQGLNPSYQNPYQQNYAHYFNGHFGQKAVAEKRIQNRPSDYTNSNFDIDNYYKEHKGLSFPYDSPITPSRYERVVPQNVVFPSSAEDSREYAKVPGGKTLKFPSDDSSDAYRRGKALLFGTYLNNKGQNELDIQKPLPNHVPTPNIFPDRTGTGELKLDIDDLEQNYQQSLAYGLNQYTQLLYDSFPNDGSYRPNFFNFPKK